MSGKIRINTSMVETFLHCRMKYKWIYEENLVPKRKSFPLQVGDFTHRVLSYYLLGKLKSEHLSDLDEIVGAAYPENTPEEAYEVAEEVARLFKGYVEAYRDDPLQLISSEIHFEVEEDEFYLYGRLDGLVRDKNGRIWRLEHKTTSRIDSAFLQGQKGGLQTGIYYHLLNRCLKERVSGTIFDIIVKTRVPQYYRSPVVYSPLVVQRSMETVRGVVRSIKRGDIYPSSNCFGFNTTCEYEPLCQRDTQEIRDALYVKRERGSFNPKDLKLTK